MRRKFAAMMFFLLAAGTQWLIAQEARTEASSAPHVKAEDLLTSPVGENWPSYNGDYSGRRFSSLREINKANVAQLRAAWIFHPGNSQRLEATPVVIRGVMYVTSANDGYALDARTGRALWHYQRPVSSGPLDDAAAPKTRSTPTLKDFVHSQNHRPHLLCLE